MVWACDLKVNTLKGNVLHEMYWKMDLGMWRAVELGTYHKMDLGMWRAVELGTDHKMDLGMWTEEVCGS